MSRRLRISEGEYVMLDNEKIDQVDTCTYLGSIKDGGCRGDLKSRTAKVQCLFHSWKQFGR